MSFKKIIINFAAVTVALNTIGCAAGAATAGYASKASTADGLTSEGMKTVLDTAKTQSDSYTDSQIIKTKSELTNKLLELETRVKRLESK